MTSAGDLTVFDAHHHLWELSRFPYPWLRRDAPARRFGDHSRIKCDYLVNDYLADWDGFHLAGSVHIQANTDAKDPTEETAWLQECGERTGFPTAIVAETDLTRSDARDVILRHAKCSRFRGIRTMAAWDRHGHWRFANGPGLLGDANYRSGVSTLRDMGFSLDLVVAPEQLVEVADLARAFPDLRIAVNHLGQVEPAVPATIEDWERGISCIADQTNVALKVSGLWTIDRNWSVDALRPVLSRALFHLGANRLMFGSNLPIEKLMAPISRQIASLQRLLEDEPEGTISQILYQTCRTFYRLA